MDIFLFLHLYPVFARVPGQSQLCWGWRQGYNLGLSPPADKHPHLTFAPYGDLRSVIQANVRVFWTVGGNGGTWRGTGANESNPCFDSPGLTQERTAGLGAMWFSRETGASRDVEKLHHRAQTRGTAPAGGNSPREFNRLSEGCQTLNDAGTRGRWWGGSFWR